MMLFQVMGSNNPKKSLIATLSRKNSLVVALAASIEHSVNCSNDRRKKWLYVMQQPFKGNHAVY